MVFLKPLPSVTSILSTAQTEKTRQKLATWNLLNPGLPTKQPKEERGFTVVQKTTLKGLRVVPPEKYKPYWDGVPELLDNLLKGDECCGQKNHSTNPSGVSMLETTESEEFTTTIQ
jgi:hypothetical protein